MILNAYTDEQFRTLRVLLEGIELRGYENCKNVVMMRQILDNGRKVEVKEEDNGEEIKDKGDRKRSRLHKSA
jgi:hypothetical protein